MKKIVVCFISVLFLLSCNQKKVKSSSNTVDSIVFVPKAIPAINKTVPTYTKDIYKKTIPDSVFKILDQYLPGWQFPDPQIWDALVFHEDKKDGMLVDYIYSDFNGDNKLDYACLLENNKKMCIWVLQSDIEGYVPINLYSLGDFSDKSTVYEMGISLTRKGKINYLDIDAENVKTIILKHDGITIEKFESTSAVYFWKNGKYESVTTGD